MTPTQVVFVALLLAALLALAGYYARQQVRTFRSLREAEDLSPEDRRYFVEQVRRRLLGCILMVLFAGLLAGWFALGFDEQASQLQREAAARAEDEPAGPTPEQRHTLRVVGSYLIVTLLVLLAILLTAVLDFLAIRRYAYRHQQSIREGRRAMLERQLARLRGEDNGRD